ncbi:MAG: hypothetical protein H5U40_04200, partial [Polyangiaceae bacterium]|nr:hypothetical protein [Polyangiaceae bacterium]
MTERYVELGPIEDVVLEPIGDKDLSFLAELYGSTREEELAPVPWSPDQKRAFLESQFAAQHRYYQEHYAGARFDLVSVRDRDRITPVG